ncbi:hypothetical protein YC2023_063330 [Brassica napus]
MSSTISESSKSWPRKGSLRTTVVTDEKKSHHQYETPPGCCLQRITRFILHDEDVYYEVLISLP